MNARPTPMSIPAHVVGALSEFKNLAVEYERDAKSASLLGDFRAREELLRVAFAVRSRTAALAESLIEGESAPFQAAQLDFRRSLARLHLTCGILAVGLGTWATAREHGLRAMYFDKQLEHRVLSLLVTADVSEDFA